MKLFTNRVTYTIEESLPVVLQFIKGAHDNMNIKWESNTFIAIERISYFTSSLIKDYKFIGHLEQLSAEETKLTINMASSRIGKINLSILSCLILLCFAASIHSLLTEEYKAFITLLLTSLGVGFLIAFWYSRNSFLSTIVLIERLNIPVEKVKLLS